MEEAKKKAIFIVGPTCVGKTAFSIELAKRISGEIVSADSMQVYRRMDIASQKPTPEERRRVPHYLIDAKDVREEYSAAEFAETSRLFIDKIIGRGKAPIVSGGSGLYIKALIDGIFPSPAKDISFRRSLEREAKLSGRKVLHDRLSNIDQEAASKIHPNDLRRIIRALEVFHLTGIPISEHKKKARGIKESFNIKIYGLIRPRGVLYKRIEDRVDRMFEEGLVKEIDFIRRKSPSITARASLGYSEVLGYLDKTYSLKEAKELLKKNTRRLAKRQLTFFKPDKRIRWIDLEEVPQKEALELAAKGH